MIELSEKSEEEKAKEVAENLDRAAGVANSGAGTGTGTTQAPATEAPAEDQSQPSPATPPDEEGA